MDENKQFLKGVFIREKDFDNGGSILRMDINADEMIKQLQQIKDSKGFAHIIIKKMREAKDNGITHYAEVNLFIPTPKSTGNTANFKSSKSNFLDQEDSSPF